MSEAAQKLLAEALALPEDERERLANQLFESLRLTAMPEGDHEAIEEALAESEDDVRANRVYSAAEVLAEIRRK